jgi:hypothetical protein
MMLYDTTYSLGQVFQAFLRDQSDVLDDLRDALCGECPIGSGTSHLLLSRFEQWLDEREGIVDRTHRTALMQVAEAFVELVYEPEEADACIFV